MASAFPARACVIDMGRRIARAAVECILRRIREEINPDELSKVDIVEADRDFIDGLFDFFARYVQKVHSDEFIRKGLKLG